MRQAQASERQAAGAAESSHQSLAQRVCSRIASLGGRGTNAYLEVLKPAKGFTKLINGKTIISKPGLSGGPDFVIAKVLKEYRVRSAIVERRRPDIAETVFDAFVVPDGRDWTFKGEGETSDTYQLLAPSAERLSDLQANALERILTGLPASP